MGRGRIGSKKDNLRGERRSSGRRASYRCRYGRLSCTDMKFSRSIQFSQSRMVSGSSAPRSAVALMNVSSTFIASKTSLKQRHELICPPRLEWNVYQQGERLARHLASRLGEKVTAQQQMCPLS